MELKRFKSLLKPVSIDSFDAGDENVVEVRQGIDSFAIFVNDVMVEKFFTKKVALEVAEEAADAIRTYK